MRKEKILTAAVMMLGLALCGGVSAGRDTQAYNQSDYVVVKNEFKLFNIEVDPLQVPVTEPGQAVGTTRTTRNQNATGPSLLTQIQTQAELGIQQEPILGGAQLIMLNAQGASQISSFLIQTSQGKLIVVDGGMPEDAPYLQQQILARGGRVSAWLVTHPQGDHVGALYATLQNPNSGITIDGIYYSFADLAWYQQNDAGEIGITSAMLLTFQHLPQEMLHPVSRNQEIWVDDVKIQVMNDRYSIPGAYAGNDASIVYKVTVNGKSILFLGDLAVEGGNRLLHDAGAEALKSDIVQMSHHGQDGVNEAFYQAVNPAVCLWPTPVWLWNNDSGGGAGSGSWKIAETKAWMSRLGVQIHYCMKDGDQVIR